MQTLAEQTQNDQSSLTSDQAQVQTLTQQFQQGRATVLGDDAEVHELTQQVQQVQANITDGQTQGQTLTEQVQQTLADLTGGQTQGQTLTQLVQQTLTDLTGAQAQTQALTQEVQQGLGDLTNAQTQAEALGQQIMQTLADLSAVEAQGQALIQGAQPATSGNRGTEGQSLTAPTSGVVSPDPAVTKVQGGDGPKEKGASGITQIRLGSRVIVISLGSPSSVQTPNGLANRKHQPNSRLSVIPSSTGPSTASDTSGASYVNESSGTNGPWLTFWPTGVTSLAVSSEPYPGPDESVSSTTPLIPSNYSWDNGGSWLDSVFRVKSSQLIGFFHAEHHYGCSPDVVRCTRGTLPNGKGDFWASGGISYSNDNGRTWAPASQFLTSQRAQPTTPTLGGSNFQDAVWDFQAHRWVAFYQCQGGVSCAAISDDPMGRPGTWFKYHDGTFDQPGLGGLDTPLPGLNKGRGVLYSVAYNSGVQAWVGLGRRYNANGIFVTLSSDLIHWTAPKSLLKGGDDRYPFLVGSHGTEVVGSSGMLYYVLRQGGPLLISRKVIFEDSSLPTVAGLSKLQG